MKQLKLTQVTNSRGEAERMKTAFIARHPEYEEGDFVIEETKFRSYKIKINQDYFDRFGLAKRCKLAKNRFDKYQSII